MKHIIDFFFKFYLRQRSSFHPLNLPTRTVVSYKCPQWFYYVYSALPRNNLRSSCTPHNKYFISSATDAHVHFSHATVSRILFILMKNETWKGQIKNLRDFRRNKKCGASKCVPKFNMSRTRGGERKKMGIFVAFSLSLPLYNILRQWKGWK